jgi:hypothetical protein
VGQDAASIRHHRRNTNIGGNGFRTDMINETKYKDINIQINSFAQSLRTMTQMTDWFESNDNQLKRNIINQIWDFLQNTRPTKDEINEGINKSEQKDSYTAAIILRRFSFKEARHKILELPDNELTKTFKFIIAIFKVSDTRRRTMECKGQCGHFWHNLDKEPVD